jgi:hypothetical protein
MIYLKSAGVGLLFAIAAVIVNVAVQGFLLGPHVPADVSVGWDPISAARSPGLWLIGGAFFVAGFIWHWRRQAR